MKAEALGLLQLFAEKIQFEVPLFQRQYVWNRVDHWEPLWIDISRKFSEYLSSNRDGPVHFLGAMVLDQKQTTTGYVPKRKVIDGQQRLTTLQIFLAALRDFCREHHAELSKEIAEHTFNKGMIQTPGVDEYKVWPTQLDRDQFVDVISANSIGALNEKYPLKKLYRARKFKPRLQMVEAYAYFHEALTTFFIGGPEEPAKHADIPLEKRLVDSYHALLNALRVVVIDLEDGDDAQVIFETLNARGEPLLPADLIRNYVFLRAAHSGESQQELYDQYWKQFDDQFWREQVTQGRLKRPRSDIFMGYYLSSRIGREVPVKNVFAEYKHWIEKRRPFASVQDEVKLLAHQGRAFRELVNSDSKNPFGSLAHFLDVFETGTCYPLLLGFLDSDCADDEKRAVAGVLESYILRRAVCGLGGKNYNNIFLALLRTCQLQGFRLQVVTAHLHTLEGFSAKFPNDAELREAWLERNAYVLMTPKVSYILEQLNADLYTSKSESMTLQKPLTIEHLMPQSWIEHWPLPTGEQGIKRNDMLQHPDDPRLEPTMARNEAIQTFGNLTLLMQSLNGSISNGPWNRKREQILLHSSLPINQQLHRSTEWDVADIEARGLALFERAKTIWSFD